jgi:hypothetical protein
MTDFEVLWAKCVKLSEGTIALSNNYNHSMNMEVTNRIEDNPWVIISINAILSEHWSKSKDVLAQGSTPENVCMKFIEIQTHKRLLKKKIEELRLETSELQARLENL